MPSETTRRLRCPCCWRSDFPQAPVTACGRAWEPCGSRKASIRRAHRASIEPVEADRQQPAVGETTPSRRHLPSVAPASCSPWRRRRCATSRYRGVVLHEFSRYRCCDFRRRQPLPSGRPANMSGVRRQRAVHCISASFHRRQGWRDRRCCPEATLYVEFRGAP